MKQQTVFSMMITLCLALALSGQVVSQEKPAPAGTKQLTLDVISFWIPKSISVERQTAQPGEGHIFVALQGKREGVKSLAGFHQAMFGKDGIVGISTYPDEGGRIDSEKAVLTDSAGGRYIPIGGISGGMAFFRNRSMLGEAVKIEAPDGTPVGSKSLVYVYEIQVGRSGFKLTVGDSQPVPIEIRTP